MLLAIEDLQFVNSTSAVTPTYPFGSNGAALGNLQNFSTFAPNGYVTVKKGGSAIPAGLAVTVFADFSCWVPALQSFVPPENTNLSSKLNQGTGT